MRRLLSIAVLPLMLVVALVVSAAAMERGVPSSGILLPMFLTSAILVALLERVIPYRPEWNRRQGDVWTDAAYLPTTWLVGSVMQPLIAVVAVALGAGASRTLGMGLWPVDWPLPAQLLLVWVVVEFFDYWAHRWIHEVPSLWRFHAVHHSAPRLYWLNATRSHPGEMAFRGVFNLLPIGIAGAGETVLVLSGITNMVVGLFQHANVDIRLGPLNYFFSAAPVHRWHHSRDRLEADHNYGNTFIFWDLVFGTYFHPAHRAVGTRLGIDGLDAFPRTFPAQLVAPFRWRRIEGASTGMARPVG